LQVFDGENRGVYHRPVDDVTAFVLAGGKSTRMGRDKAFLELDGKTLLELAMARARSLTKDVRIVGSPAKFAAFGPVVEDIFPERGPLGAIHAALRASANELNLMLAVDTPLVQPSFLAWMVKRAQGNRAVVTVPSVGGRLHPLCGVYRKSFAMTAEESLQAGQNKIDRLFAEIATEVIAEEEIVAAGFSAEMFHNVNTPEEWKAVTSTEYPVPSKNK
jgi:molybdopterin-guanine dinucleotide biosynthesis protein A